jgi:glycosyltransferase involved in cell wall biosynthesis
MINHLSIDLIICTYNNVALLDRTLIAISKQQVPPEVEWKVLVVNNNCTDETMAVVDRHLKLGKIPGLSMVLEPRQGLTPARLCGVENTTADWVAFIDDDCLLERDWVAQAAKFTLAHPDCGAFGGRVLLDWEAPPPAYVLKYGYSFAEQDHGTASKPVPFIAGAGLVVRRAALADCGWIDKQFLSDRVGKKLISGGDVEIVLRLAAKYDLWYNPECQLRHIIPLGRTSKRYLIAINYGLGISQQYADGMLWSGSYLTWLFVSIYYTFRSSVNVLLQALQVAIRRIGVVELLINLSFVLGRWVGIWKMCCMNAQKRQELLGCAKVATLPN